MKQKNSNIKISNCRKCGGEIIHAVVKQNSIVLDNTKPTYKSIGQGGISGPKFDEDKSSYCEHEC